MSQTKSVLIGHANGDIHTIQVLDRQDVSQLATEEADQIGKLTTAGVRTIVAAVWTSDEKKTAGLTYAAAWNENEVEVLADAKIERDGAVLGGHDLVSLARETPRQDIPVRGVVVDN